MTALQSVMHRVSLNTVWLLASRVISQGLSAITVILLARILGADGLGQYAFVTSIIFIANALTTYGTDTLIIREVARDASAAPRWLTAALIVQLTLSLITIAVIWVISDSLILRLYSPALLPL
jgi:O-antigen/teichoic acid export membrane protein